MTIQGKRNKSKHKIKFPFNGFGLCFLSLYQLMGKSRLANTNLIEHNLPLQVNTLKLITHRLKHNL